MHAWTEVGARQHEIARLLDADAVVYGKGRLRGRAWAPVRWAMHGLRLLVLLATTRPGLVVVTNPPIWPAVICAAWLSLRRGVFILDSHPGGFGRQNDPVGRRVQRLHRRLAVRAAAVLVTTQELADVVSDWGGTAVVFHEAPMEWEVPRKAPTAGPVDVLYIGNFNADEPTDVILEAARTATHWRLSVTGDPAKAPPALSAGEVGPAIRFLGWLQQAEYLEALANSDIICVLTTEPTSVMRAAIEAVHAVRPLIVSDTPATRTAFPHAVHVENHAQPIRAAIDRVVSDLHAYVASAELARREADRLAQQQAAALRNLATGSRLRGRM